MLRLYYYKDPRGNFGDDLNLWLWPKILPNIIDIENPYYAFDNASTCNRSDNLFVGIGSLLNHRLPEQCKKIVVGSGYAYGKVPLVDNTWSVFAVRGPITAKLLKLDSSLAITDSAIFVRNFHLEPIKKKYRCSFLSYHETAEIIRWRQICRAIGIKYIDPSDGVENILIDIMKSEMLVCEAMHGAIVADALRVPWIPVKIFSSINDLKWEDWCGSLGLEYNPIALAYLNLDKNINYFKRSYKRAKTIAVVCKKLFRISNLYEPILSTDESIDSVTERMNEKVHQLQKIYQRLD